MKYIVIEASHPFELSEQINKYISNSWILQGGVSVAVTQGNYKIFAQAMIKQS